MLPSEFNGGESLSSEINEEESLSPEINGGELLSLEISGEELFSSEINGEELKNAKASRVDQRSDGHWVENWEMAMLDRRGCPGALSPRVRGEGTRRGGRA